MACWAVILAAILGVCRGCNDSVLCSGHGTTNDTNMLDGCKPCICDLNWVTGDLPWFVPTTLTARPTTTTSSTSERSQNEEDYEICPFNPDVSNIQERCVGKQLISGQGEDDDILCGENGDLTAWELRDTVSRRAVCSWPSLVDGDMYRWCCCKDGDCFEDQDPDVGEAAAIFQFDESLLGAWGMANAELYTVMLTSEAAGHHAGPACYQYVDPAEPAEENDGKGISLEGGTDGNVDKDVVQVQKESLKDGGDEIQGIEVPGGVSSGNSSSTDRLSLPSSFVMALAALFFLIGARV